MSRTGRQNPAAFALCCFLQRWEASLAGQNHPSPLCLGLSRGGSLKLERRTDWKLLKDPVPAFLLANVAGLALKPAQSDVMAVWSESKFHSGVGIATGIFYPVSPFTLSPAFALPVQPV
ncbi:hypothetical protein F5144DRAFT_44392 [Chaetomium tenue]|uniref:Uncharacterized protein n=1 Tax=Chaetomium tenue TaxID=1854479 RepID=A0ACB7PMT3_9PEZI|nr:hypothetical protein F5144DRAFT_44392 [Chaetomium globosum]